MIPLVARQELPVPGDLLDPFFDKVDTGALREIDEGLGELLGADPRLRSGIVVDPLVRAPSREYPPPAVPFEDRRAKHFPAAVRRRGKPGRASPHNDDVVVGPRRDGGEAGFRVSLLCNA